MLDMKKCYVSSVNTTTNSRKTALTKVKNVLKRADVQFILLGAIFCLVQIISMINKSIIPTKYVSVIANIMIYTIVSVGFCFLLGYAGLVSLGSSCFVGIGAYSIFYIMQIAGLPYILSILMALAISLVLGFAIGFVSLRIEGLFLGIVTLGLSEIIRNVLREIYSQAILLRNSKLKLLGIKIGTNGMYFVIAVIMVLCFILLYNLMHSPTGRNMLAMKNSKSAAQAFGVNILRNRILAFVIACMLAGLTGVCYASYGYSITPSNTTDPILSITLSLNILAAVIIGGYKSLWGTFGGVVFVFGFSSILSAIAPRLQSQIAAYMSIIIGVLIIVIVMFYPGGFYQLVFETKYKIRAFKERKRVQTYGNEE